VAKPFGAVVVGYQCGWDGQLGKKRLPLVAGLAPPLPSPSPDPASPPLLLSPADTNFDSNRESADIVGWKPLELSLYPNSCPADSALPFPGAECTGLVTISAVSEHPWSLLLGY